ncbi:MAG TPA: sortase [Candidatus Limnocylindria bacterium]|nr:sortase [Candidatus Limnocylindria bacterium]
MKITRLINLIGGTLVLAGTVVVLYGMYARSANARVQAQPQITAQNSVRPQITEENVIQGEPAELAIPGLGIKNSVIAGVFNSQNGQWTLTLDKVQHAIITHTPNDSRGVTFLYGHNRPEVFARLPQIQPGAEAVIKTKNGHTFRYRFKDSRTTSPADVSVFEYDGPPILVLQTCTGVFFQHRQLFTFEFVGVK